MSLLDALAGGSLSTDSGTGPGAQECSRAGCREPAVWSIGWRNPKIHSADRVKVWVACGGHLDFLREFLSARSFPVAVVPFGETPDAASLVVPA